jgi:hypothetical protein
VTAGVESETVLACRQSKEDANIGRGVQSLAGRQKFRREPEIRDVSTHTFGYRERERGSTLLWIEGVGVGVGVGVGEGRREGKRERERERERER